jgi:glutamate synthase (NADPH/NADH) small chain
VTMSGLSREQLREEAKRCLKCKAPRCQKACPIATDIPLIMQLFQEGREQ